MHPPLPLRSPVLVHALYHGTPDLITDALARSLAQLPTSSGHVWHFSWPTSTSVTLWSSAASPLPPALTLHLGLRPPAVCLWTLATTPDHLLLSAALILAVDEALPRFAAARGLPCRGRHARWPSSRQSPLPAPWCRHGGSGGWS